ncbi:hypothetical protein KIN20_000528 [Parelaphostrongylus tenuis]|uniref:Peptidase M13 C-terminal domain-containing protein n=1 Tax=Parelaphostrongylus tenuis TaxID=148309 RepID=A0AAD5QG47_PARTN|nr:hypothetical protein KIN20_000528 [Parelaphostrongylus tenuis]
MRAIFESPEVLPSKSAGILKEMYRRCMDKDEFDRIGGRNLINSIRGFGISWPMLEGDKWHAEHFNLTALLIDVSESRKVRVFHQHLRHHRQKECFTKTDQGELGLGDSTRDYYFYKEKYWRKISAYREYLISKVKLLHEDANVPINEGKIANGVDEIIELETRLARIQEDDAHRRNYTKMYNLRRLSDMQTLMPLQFHHHMYGRKEKAPRWKDCTTTTMLRLQYASGAMYVKKAFNEETKNATLEMINDLQEAFHDTLIENKWIDNATKAKALNKARHMVRHIGYPDFILDDKKLDDYYSGLSIEESDSYSQMVEKLIRWSIEFSFKRLLKPVDRAEFSINPAIVNAMYSTKSNSIKFPAAILQAPFFHKTFPKALNFGGIGTIIGHEITHGFDDKGRQFDAVWKSTRLVE